MLQMIILDLAIYEMAERKSFQREVDYERNSKFDF